MRTIGLCFLFCLMGCDGAVQPAPKTPTPPQPTSTIKKDAATITVATFNVHYANREWEDTSAVIQAAEVDIVCLQEPSTEMEQFLTARLASSHPHQFFSGPGGVSVADQFAFFSRYPLHSPQRIARSRGLFDSWVVNADFLGTEIQIVSVHLQPVLFSEGAGPLQAVQQMQAVDDIHRAELQAILAGIDQSLPTLIVGDFNSLASADGMSPLVDARMKDAVEETTDSPETHTTWEWPTPWGKGAMRIDHLWHNAAWEAESTQIIPAKGSDHRLLVGRFRLEAR
jgi:endonuclease/exonuclease/phosphatase (EEP) superfamily protein YafD